MAHEDLHEAASELTEATRWWYQSTASSSSMSEMIALCISRVASVSSDAVSCKSSCAMPLPSLLQVDIRQSMP